MGSIPMDPWTDNWWIKVSGCKFHKLKSELKGIEKCSINAMSLRYAGKFKIIINNWFSSKTTTNPNVTGVTVALN